MKKPSFEKGQIVYIQGEWKARVIEPGLHGIKVKVLDRKGLPAYDERKGIYTFAPSLLKIKKDE